MVAQIIAEADYVVATYIAKTDLADSSREFLRYIRYNGFFHLGGNVTVYVFSEKPGVQESIKLQNLSTKHEGRTVRYYIGMDQSIMKNFTDLDNIVLRPSDDSDRRQVQLHFINQAHIPMISDNPQVTKEYHSSD